MYACKTIIMRQVVLCYKIGFREGVHTSGVSTILVPGFGVGLRVQGSTARSRTPGSFSDYWVGLVVWVEELGVLEDELGVLEDELGVSVSTTWASGCSASDPGRSA